MIHKAWRSRGMQGGSWTQDAATSRAVRLCLSLAGSLAGLHRKTSMRGWEKLTAAGVGIFLDWLTCRPQFGEGARGTRLEEFQHVMACVVEFANGIIRAATVERADRSRVAAGRSSFSSRNNRGTVAREATADEIDVDPDGPLWEDEVRVVTGRGGERRATERRERCSLVLVRFLLFGGFVFGKRCAQEIFYRFAHPTVSTFIRSFCNTMSN